MRNLLVLSMALTGLLLAAVSLEATEEIDIPNLFEDAKVGEWVLYESQGGIQMKQTISAISDKDVTIKVETIMNGQSLSTIEQKIPKDMKKSFQLQPDAPKPKVTRGEMTVKGKTVNGWIVELESNGQKMKTYLAKEVPINGLVMTEMGGKVMMKLLDFGRE